MTFLKCNDLLVKVDDTEYGRDLGTILFANHFMEEYIDTPELSDLIVKIDFPKQEVDISFYDHEGGNLVKQILKISDVDIPDNEVFTIENL